MAITKRVEDNNVQILNDGRIRRVMDIIFEEDGVEVARKTVTKVIEVEEDVTAEPETIKRITSAVWTKELKDAARAKRELLKPVAPEVGRE